jgi:hypothetical protein
MYLPVSWTSWNLHDGKCYQRLRYGPDFFYRALTGSVKKGNSRSIASHCDNQ